MDTCEELSQSPISGRSVSEMLSSSSTLLASTRHKALLAGGVFLRSFFPVKTRIPCHLSGSCSRSILIPSKIAQSRIIYRDRLTALFKALMPCSVPAKPVRRRRWLTVMRSEGFQTSLMRQNHRLIFQKSFNFNRLPCDPAENRFPQPTH